MRTQITRFAGFVAVTAGVLTAAPSSASAHGLHGLLNDDYLTVGVDLGHTSRLDGSGEGSMIGGFDVSWVRMRDFYWSGFLGELRYEGTSKSAFVALGAEGGWFLFGADLSAVARLGRQSAFGARLRGCLSLAVFSGCGGAALMTRGSFAEVTAMVKMPIDWTPRFVRRRRG